MRSRNKTILITTGDPGGIGPEIILRSLRDPAISRLARFIIIGDQKNYPASLKDLPAPHEFLDLAHSFAHRIVIGDTNPFNARASLAYLNKAISLLKENKAAGLVTAPICKESICSLGKKFSGHTEYLAQAFHVKKFDMMFVAGKLKVVTATRHIPINKLHSAITKERVLASIVLPTQILKKHFKIHKPKIAVCGLNPHAGEKGTIGREEIDEIIPAIKKAQKLGINACGPFSADTLFYPKNTAQYDLIIAMFHDQGLAPIKALYFKELVNVTIGLPIIRTSPAHGTAFHLAGKGKADASSMKSAIKLAAQLVG
ncbi:MAG: 4-hydroxythreonine-4-phosphate dehydrogenase PdxA [Candidatus Omnitrophota bacterium]